jgi:polysaccharide export outer membrane protein
MAMVIQFARVRLVVSAGLVALTIFMTGCSSQFRDAPELPTASGDQQWATRYRIAPGDSVQIFVWRNPEVTASVPVRPDGVISAPLLEEIPAAGKTANELARDLEEELSTYLRDPLVTVIVNGFVGNFSEQIRVLGAVRGNRETEYLIAPILYRDAMTLLDVMIQVGGLSEFADGNNAGLLRSVDGEPQVYRLRLGDLVRKGDYTANVDMRPGDVVIIPEAWF